MTKRSTKAEKLKREAIVYKMLLTETPRPEICQFMTEKYRLSERQVDRYIKDAAEKLEKDISRKTKAGLSYHLSKRDLLFNRAYKDNNINLALSVLRDRAKLEGLYVENINLNSSNQHTHQFTGKSLEEMKEFSEFLRNKVSKKEKALKNKDGQ